MGTPSLSLAGTDKKLENAAAAAQQPNWDPRWGLEKLKAAPAPYTWHGKREGCAKLGNLQETFKKIAIKTREKERNEEDDFAWKGRNTQQLTAFWKGPFGEGLGLWGEHTVAHGVSGHVATR